MARLPCQNLGHGDAFVFGLVGQHGALDHVADGIDAGDAGCEFLIDRDPPAIVGLDLKLGEPEALGVGYAPHRDQHDIAVKRLRLAAARWLKRQLHALALGLDAHDFGGELKGHALLGQDALQLLRHLAVEAWRQAIEHLDHGHLRAQPRPDRAELKPDIARADHHQPLRHACQGQRAGRGDDRLLVDGDAGEGSHLRPRGDEDGLGLKRLLLAVGAGHLDLAGCRNAAFSPHRVDLVLLQEELDAVNIALHARILEGEHGGEVELWRDFDAHAGEAVGGFGITLACMQQRL